MTALAMAPTRDPRPTLKELASALAAWDARLVGDGAVRPSGVRQDSRAVEAGELFCARSGEAANGADFAAAAVKRGAVALLVPRGSELPALGVPMLVVSDVRRATAFAAELVYGRPSRALALVGVTGTNGKTTTAILVEHALNVLGRKPARLGTLGFSFAGAAQSGSLTTPEADDVSRLIARVVAEGGSEFVMEASSHALAQGRVDALTFDVAAFTNLSQDHLDFHASMEEYGATKARLFTELSPRVSVVNVDDPFGNLLAKRASGEVLRVGRSEGANVRPMTVVVDGRGIRGGIATPKGTAVVDSRLVGEHNLENLLVALGVLVGLGFEPGAAASALGSAPQVPGRLERCDDDRDDIRVLVDYAHTPDALERILSAVRGVTDGDVICVFGCGGDRDPHKRPKMGAAVANGAARAIVTSDNPRSEEPAAIVRAIVLGFAGSTTPYEVELDRARAIERAVLEARAGDAVVVAGKGHETEQLVGAERRPFDDRVEARRALELRRRREGV
jgi:UDP-N-acetylmuramoyl-L-alanyl-D-glutamate--2,6-diaminopimelate ligase